MLLCLWLVDVCDWLVSLFAVDCLYGYCLVYEFWFVVFDVVFVVIRCCIVAAWVWWFMIVYFACVAAFVVGFWLVVYRLLCISFVVVLCLRWFAVNSVGHCILWILYA